METIPELKNQSISTVNDIEEKRIRRPPNAFMLFGKQYRRVLAQKFGNLSNKQISKILGNEWKNMDPNSKSHYHNMAKEAYRTHLERYPDYHYNPLEARLRKAERKRKYKTTRVSHKSKVKNQLIVPIIKPFGGKVSNSYPNTTFAFIQSPTTLYVQPIITERSDSVIGIKRLSHSTMEGLSRDVCPIEHRDHNYMFQIEENFSQNLIFEKSLKSENQQFEIQIPENQMEWNQSFEYLVNCLPPMLDPTTQVTPVSQIEDNINGDSMDATHEITMNSEFETKDEVMADCHQIDGQQIDLKAFIKSEVIEEQIQD